MTPYYLFGATTLVLITLYLFLRKHLIKRKDENETNSVALEMFFSMHPVIYVLLSLYVASFFLTLPGIWPQVLHSIAAILVAYQIVASLGRLEKIYLETDGNQNKQQIADLLRAVVSIVLLGFAAVFVLSNFGFNVSALLTGMGIGGIAIAFAAQNILRDIFSYISILMDKPIQIGDEVHIDGKGGTVKKITMQSTHIRGAQGEIYVVSNERITSIDLKNFRKIKRRRKDFVLPFAPDTDPQSLLSLPEEVKELFESEFPQTTFIRAFIKHVDGTSMDFQISYWVNTRKYQTYAEIHHRLNVLLTEHLNNKGIALAPIQKHYQDSASMKY